MHNQFLLAALDMARSFRGFCSPNPSVGAIIVRDKQIVAKAAHHGAGTAHAEQAVLAETQGDLSSACLYVTLEPCNHWGKTPPCVNTIIESGLKKVVFAYLDPHPIVSTRDSSALLRSHGIEVIHHPVAEIDAFYVSYAHWLKHKKPFVTAKLAMSFDGKVAGEAGQPLAITGPKINQFTHQQRKKTDWILSTSQTVLTDNPRFNARLADTSHAKPVALLDRQLKITANCDLFNHASQVTLFHDSEVKIQHVCPKARYASVSAPNGRLSLQEILAFLGDKGCHDVWVEGGPALFSYLHENQLVHHTYLYIAPKMLGEKAKPACLGEGFFEQGHSITWQQFGQDVMASIIWESR